jgi:hypothetical protein
MKLQVEAESTAGLLCRLIGLAAQLDLPAPAMRVGVTDQIMMIELELVGVDRHLGTILAWKMARCVGVTHVSVDGLPLDPPCGALAA